MYMNGETIAIAVSIISLITALVTVSWKLFKWINHQKEQDEKIKQLEERHKADQSGMQEEQTLIIYGLLACLKGLKEQGCNGPVSEAVEKIEKHLNKQAHRS
jgi:RAB protein geranylgeranyltransferase component A